MNQEIWAGATPWGGGTRGPCPLFTGTWCPPNENGTAVEKLADSTGRASLLAVTVVIVNCNGTVVVVPFVQCQ